MFSIKQVYFSPNVYAKNIFNAANAQIALGIGVVCGLPLLAQKFQSYHDSSTKFNTVNRNPTNVIVFGAIQGGKNW